MSGDSLRSMVLRAFFVLMKVTTALRCLTTTTDRIVGKGVTLLVVISRNKKVWMIHPVEVATEGLVVAVDVAEVVAHDADAERRVKSLFLQCTRTGFAFLILQCRKQSRWRESGTTARCRWQCWNESQQQQPSPTSKTHEWWRFRYWTTEWWVSDAPIHTSRSTRHSSAGTEEQQNDENKAAAGEQRKGVNRR